MTRLLFKLYVPLLLVGLIIGWLTVVDGFGATVALVT